jgi:hypothetical protein
MKTNEFVFASFGLQAFPDGWRTSRRFRRIRSRGKFDAFGVRGCASVMPKCKHFVATLGLHAFPSRGRRSRPLRILVLWAFPHIYMRSGYILGAIGCAYACRSPPQNQASLRESCPQGVTIPNADAKFFCR